MVKHRKAGRACLSAAGEMAETLYAADAGLKL
jgi:hypothetical protein